MRLEKGKRLIQILRQDRYIANTSRKQVMILFAGANNYLMDIPVHQVIRFENEIFEYMDTHHREYGKAIVDRMVLNDEIKQQLIEAIE